VIQRNLCVQLWKCPIVLPGHSGPCPFTPSAPYNSNPRKKGPNPIEAHATNSRCRSGPNASRPPRNEASQKEVRSQISLIRWYSGNCCFHFKELLQVCERRARFVDVGRALHFHGTGRLNVVVVVVSVTADTAHLIAVVGLFPGFIDLLFCGVLGNVLCKSIVSTFVLPFIVSFDRPYL